MHEEDDAEVRTILERVANYYGFVPRIYQGSGTTQQRSKHFSMTMSSWRLIKR
jgi:hypothetical protein